MIGKLRGIIDEVSEESIILDVNGVGYEIFTHPRLLGALEKGTAAELIIETHVREDHFHLYGFQDMQERNWFRLLTTVQGVGVKMGMAILGAFSLDQITTAIAAGDTAMLTRVSGVGPKLAMRIVTELKGKVGKMPVANVIPMTAPAKGKAKAPTPSFAADAVSALVNLGYGRSEAFTAVATAQRNVGEDSGLDVLIRHGLKELAR